MAAFTEEMEKMVEDKPTAKISDFHMHLNGSLSRKFLKKVAKRNACLHLYEKLIALQEKYAELSKNVTAEGYSQESIALIWQQFDVIHEIIQTPKDVEEAVMDAINHSADYTEIRTTPRVKNGTSQEEYIAAFVRGLQENRKINAEKKAYGLLSLDRTLHSWSDAQTIIDIVAENKKRNRLLVGIDISGNPLRKRSLTGEDLANTIRYALDKGIGIGIHMGEVNSPMEEQEIDTILATLETYNKKNLPNFFQGKVRLGHCIYLTEKQKERIRALSLTIEVTPTCHRKLNWSPKGKPHPVTTIYPKVEDRQRFCVAGSDDFGVFYSPITHENKIMGKEIYGLSNESDLAKVLEKQSSARFSNIDNQKAATWFPTNKLLVEDENTDSDNIGVTPYVESIIEASHALHEALKFIPTTERTNPKTNNLAEKAQGNEKSVASAVEFARIVRNATDLIYSTLIADKKVEEARLLKVDGIPVPHAVQAIALLTARNACEPMSEENRVQWVAKEYLRIINTLKSEPNKSPDWVFSLKEEIAGNRTKSQKNSVDPDNQKDSNNPADLNKKNNNIKAADFVPQNERKRQKSRKFLEGYFFTRSKMCGSHVESEILKPLEGKMFRRPILTPTV